MNITPLRYLQLYERNQKIRVRICRIWKKKDFNDPDKVTSLDCILVDTDGDAIQTTMKSWDCDYFSAQLEVGIVYEIGGFYSKENKDFSKVVPHEGKLEFSRKTSIRKIKNVGPNIPNHRFYLVDYNFLAERIGNYSLPTDILGRISAVQLLENRPLEKISRVKSKLEFILQNLRKEEIRITLWGEIARDDNIQGLEKMEQPVFAVFTRLKVKYYMKKHCLSSTGSTLCFLNPNIPELDSYKLVFESSTFPIEVLTASKNVHLTSDEMKLINRKTIAELQLLDPCRNKVTINHSIRTLTLLFKMELIVENDTDRTSLMFIIKAVDKFLGFSCHKLVYEYGYDDPKNLPPSLASLEGRPYIFKVRFGNVRNDFVIMHMFEDDVVIAPNVSLPPLGERAITIDKKKRPLEALKENEPNKKIKPVSSHMFMYVCKITLFCTIFLK